MKTTTSLINLSAICVGTSYKAMTMNEMRITLRRIPYGVFRTIDRSDMRHSKHLVRQVRKEFVTEEREPVSDFMLLAARANESNAMKAVCW